MHATAGSVRLAVDLLATPAAHVRRRLRTPPILVSALLLAAPASAQAAVGDRLSTFSPPQGGNGRALEVQPGTRTGYYSTISSEDQIRRVDMATQAALSSLDTNLDQSQPGRTFGALSWDSATGTLVGSEYNSTAGRVYRIDPASGAVTLLFDAGETDLQLRGLDGLAVDPADGSLFVSGDGLGLPSTRIYHFTASGTQIGTPIEVPFGNSGIAVDGDDLWLANVDGKRIHRYTKAGVDTGASFTAGEDLEPEDLTVDTCTFPGRKALWVHSAALGSAGPMAAYEIGASTNPGCPQGAGTPSLRDPGAPTEIKFGGRGGTARALLPLVLDARSLLDPTGALFVYVWVFDDYRIDLDRPRRKPRKLGPRRAGGRVTHSYRCAGFYRPRVTVIDASGARKLISASLAVAFPSRATRRHGSLAVSPQLRSSGGVASVSLRVRRLRRSPRTALRSITYRLDGRRAGTRRRASSPVRRRIARGRPHVLDITVRFAGPHGTKRIRTCFKLA